MKRNPQLIVRPTAFQAMSDHIVAVVDLGYVPALGKSMTVGIRFVSPQHLLTFMSDAMEEAAKVWPDDPWVKSYKEE
jgi:hypothetical protein